MEIAALVVSGLMLLVSFAVLLINSRKDTRVDAAQGARTEAKLDTISSGVTEIRVDMRTMQNEIKDHGQRLVAVEGSAKSAHHRLDELEQLFHKAHPPKTVLYNTKEERE